MKRSLYLILVSLMLLNSCKKLDSGFNLGISTNLFKYSLLLQFKYASNDKMANNVKIELLGDDANYLYNNAGRKNFTVNKDGNIYIVVALGGEPKPGNPLVFYVEATADGCLPLTQKIVLNSAENNKKVILYLDNYASPPNGVKVKTQSYALSNGVLANQNGVVTLDGGNPNDTAYYDDGLTSVVLPKGTSFYYYEFVETGKLDTTTSYSQTIGNTQTISRKPFKGYYETQQEIHPIKEWQRKIFTGDSVNVILYNQPGSDINIKVIPEIINNTDYTLVSPTVQIQLLNGQLAREDELLFKNAVTKRITSVSFVGTKNGKKIIISPDASFDWFTSTVLDPNVINPQTGVAIKVGDTIEVDIDRDSLKTGRAIIKQAANGQLRVHSQAYNTGYFYKANYTRTISYLFNTTIRQDLEERYKIPDLENVGSSANLLIDNQSYYRFYFSPNTGISNYRFKVSSVNPVTDNVDCNTYYANNLLISNADRVNLFNPPYLIQLNPEVTFNITLNCPEKNKSGTMNYRSSQNINNLGDIVFNFSESIWKSKLFAIGDKFSLTGYYGDDIVIQTIHITSNYYQDQITSNSKDFCDCVK